MTNNVKQMTLTLFVGKLMIIKRVNALIITYTLESNATPIRVGVIGLIMTGFPNIGLI
jgi:hypothetical protein